MDRTSQPAFAVTLAPSDVGQVVKISGDLDLSTVDQLRNALQSAAGPGSSTSLRLDLSQVAFLDCATIGLLISVNAGTTQPDTRVVITDASPIVAELLNRFDLGAAFGYATRSDPTQTPPSPPASRRWAWRPLIRRRQTVGH